MMVTFRGRRKGASCFGASKSTFRDRCKGSELFYVEVQLSWQVQHFGHGGDRGGAVNRDFWTCMWFVCRRSTL